MRRVFGPRFLVEVALIAAAAAVGVLADLRRLWVFIVIWAAWLLVVAVEWGISRRAGREISPPREPEPELEAFGCRVVSYAVTNVPPN